MTAPLFDATTFADKAPRDLLPQGDYRAIITACEKKPTSKGDGHYLKFSFTVLEGEHKDRMQWSNFNLWNPSAQAVQIAQGEMKQLCMAVGVLAPKSEQDFVGRTLVLTVKVSKRRDNGEPENRVSGYAADAGAGVARATAPAPTPGGAKWGAARPAA
jgi:hypothetical protein